MDFDFSTLDLSQNKVELGRSTLKPGRYACVIKEAKIVVSPKGATMLRVVFLEEESGLTASTNFTMALKRTDDNARKAIDIARNKLKTLLTLSGHPSPNNPGDVASLIGHRVGVVVEAGEDWIDDKGVKRKGGGHVAQNNAFFELKDHQPSAAGSPPPGKPDLPW